MKSKYFFSFLLITLLLFSCSEEEKLQTMKILSFTPSKALENDKIQVVVENLPDDKRNLILEVNQLEYPIEQISGDTLYAYIPKGASTGKLRIIYKSNDALSEEELIINKFEIIDFIPNVGFANDIISISGNGFTTDKNLLNVEFNGVRADILQSNETTILAKVPQSATTGRIKITYNGSSVTSQYDFKIVDNPTGGGGSDFKASDYLPNSNKYYLFDNWDYDAENKRTGSPIEDSTFIVENIIFKSFPSSEYNIINKTNFQLSKKYYRTNGAVLLSDGASESKLPPMIAEQIGSDIDWVPILDLQNLSWQVYEFDNISFTLPFNGQNVNIKVSSVGTAKRNPVKRIEKIANEDLEIIEVEYNFKTNLTITFGIIPIQQEINTKSTYWFSKGYGIVKEMNFNVDEQGGALPIGGDLVSPGERILKKIFSK